MSFLFKKLSSDAVSFKEKNTKRKKKPTKTSTSTNFENDPSAPTDKGPYSIQINNSSGIHFGHVFSFNNTNVYNESTDLPEPQCSDSPTHSLSQDMEDNFCKIDEVTNSQLIIVSESVGKYWKELGLQLGFSENDLEKFQPTEEGIYNLLRTWKNAKTKEATVGRLLKCLWDVHEYNAAKRLSADIDSLT